MRLWKCGIDIGNSRYTIDNYNSAIQFLDIRKKDNKINDNDSTKYKSVVVLLIEITKSQCVSLSERYGSIATDTLSRHFSKPIFSDYYNKIFGQLQYIGIRQNINDKNSGMSTDS